MSHWGVFQGIKYASPPRTEFLVNALENQDASYMENWWKYIVGTPNVPDSFLKLGGDSGRTKGRYPYNLCEVVNSKTSIYLFQASNMSGFEGVSERAAQLRRLATLPDTCRDNAQEVSFILFKTTSFQVELR